MKNKTKTKIPKKRTTKKTKVKRRITPKSKTKKSPTKVKYDNPVSVNSMFVNPQTLKKLTFETMKIAKALAQQNKPLSQL